jgi:putative phosphoesterase
MRIAAIADVHGNLDALRAVLTHIERVSSPDLIVNLGDHLSGPLQPRETADLLMSTLQIAIRGNHDRRLLEGSTERGSVDRYAAEQLDEIHFSWLRGLAATAWIEKEIFLCHGTPASDRKYFLENPNERGIDQATREQVADRAGDCPASLILCGHSHIPRAVRLEDGRLIVNPGSVGIRFCGGDPQFREPCACYAVLDGPAEWRVAFFQLKYDGEKAARIAGSLGYSNWADALSGRPLK